MRRSFATPDRNGRVMVARRTLCFASLTLAFATPVLAESLRLSVAGAIVELDSMGESALTLSFGPDSARQLAAFTARHIGKQMEIRADGKVLSAPWIMEPIPGHVAQIRGVFSQAELDDLAQRLGRAGATVDVSIVVEGSR